MALSWHSRSLFASVGIGGAAHGGADTRRHPRGLAFRLPVSGAVMPDRAPSLPRASHRARTLAATAWRRWSATAVRDCCTTRCRSRARTAARTKSESSDAALSRKAIVLISLGVRYPSAPEFAEVPSLRSLRSTPPLATRRSRRSGAPGAVPDDRDCPRSLHRRRRSPRLRLSGWGSASRRDRRRHRCSSAPRAGAWLQRRA